jgi:hypothetical protein
LPEGLLEKIFSFLDLYGEYPAAAATCRLWNHVLLREVNLSAYPHITDAQLISFIALLKKKATLKLHSEKIHSINLCGCNRITSTGFNALEKIPISSLNLDKCRLNEECIHCLQRISGLDHVVLSKFLVGACYAHIAAEPKHPIHCLSHVKHIEYGTRRNSMRI